VWIKRPMLKRKETNGVPASLGFSNTRLLESQPQVPAFAASNHDGNNEDDPDDNAHKKKKTKSSADHYSTIDLAVNRLPMQAQRLASHQMEEAEGDF
jgi:hypothetical protein